MIFIGMEGSHSRPRDSTSLEKHPDHSVLFFESTISSLLTAKAVEAANPLCDVVNGEAIKLKQCPLQSLARLPPKDTCLVISGGDLGNAKRAHGNGVRYFLRETRVRQASKHETLLALSKDSEPEILKEPSIISAQSAPEPEKFDRSTHTFDANPLKVSAQHELMVAVQNPAMKEPASSVKSSILQRLRGRRSVVKNSSLLIGKGTPAYEEGNETQTGKLESEIAVRNEKRSRKEDAKGEIECTCENEEDSSCLLDKVRSGANGQEDASRKKVKRACHMFHSIYNRLSQEGNKLDSCRNRFDLRALKLLRESSVELDFALVSLGSVPGVEVGDEFHLRVELCMLGLHRQLQAGIDFCKQDGRLLARSIISSGSSRYSDNADYSQVLIYSGSGAPNKDQKLEYGNLALKNSIDAQNLVRVIRGIEDAKIVNSRSSKLRKAVRYIYDGLYLAEKYWTEENEHGCLVYMFQLRRKLEQPELKFKQVKLRTSISFSDICIEDISYGKEKIPICVVNTIDEDSPLPFTYTKEMIYPSQYNSIPPKGCDCFDGCSDSINCACAVKNGGELPFNGRGAIVQAKPLVYECGPYCKCPLSCHNRVSQYGIKFPFEVFKTETMGWGLRSLTFIPSGSFVCEYAGELLQDDEAQKRTNDEYLFAIGNNYYDEALWEGLSYSIPELQKSNSLEVVDEVHYAVDASMFGNVARFINHSCTPNLYAQNLLYDHSNKSMPHIMLFASEDIPPLQELTYHYNYTIDQVYDSNGNIKQKVCFCGSIECSGRLY